MILKECNPGDVILIKRPPPDANKLDRYIVCKIGNTPAVQELKNKRLCCNVDSGRLVHKLEHLTVVLTDLDLQIAAYVGEYERYENLDSY